MPGSPSLASGGPLARAAARIAAESAPGAIIGVLRGADPSASATIAVAGDAQRCDGGSVPMTPGARTDAGSITKIVGTTAAAMRLVDEGSLRLDDLASRYLGPLAAGTATIDDLLQHRAGLREWWPFYLDGSRGAEALARVASMPLRYPPGEARRYSDLGFILLGAAVARIAGQPLDEAIRRLALDPLGLRETQYATPIAGDATIASSYGDVIEQGMISSGEPYPVAGSIADFHRWRSHVLIGEVNDGNAFHAFDGVAGHAGLFTTATDLLRFAALMLASAAGDGPISAPTAAAFLTAGADPEQASGFRIWPDPAGPAIGHTGFPGVAFALLPREQASVVMIINRLHVAGPPAPTEPMWRLARDAAREHLKETG